MAVLFGIAVTMGTVGRASALAFCGCCSETLSKRIAVIADSSSNGGLSVALELSDSSVSRRVEKIRDGKGASLLIGAFFRLNMSQLCYNYSDNVKFSSGNAIKS